MLERLVYVFVLSVFAVMSTVNTVFGGIVWSIAFALDFPGHRKRYLDRQKELELRKEVKTLTHSQD